MENQNKLLEIMQEIKEIAVAQNNVLTKDEIKKYLGNDLPESSMKAIYQYLGENKIKVEGYQYIPKEIKKDEEEPKVEKKEKSRREINSGLYQQEIQNLARNQKEEKQIIKEYLQGKTEYRNEIIELQLTKVIDYTKKYEKRKIQKDELIAEGNVGLMLAMQIIEQDKERYVSSDGKVDFEAFYGTIQLEITHAMESYIDEMTMSKDWEDAVLAKTNLLHEAAKYMTEEMGRVPTIDELSEYTMISRDEIHDIMGLSEDAKRVANPDKN